MSSKQAKELFNIFLDFVDPNYNSAYAKWNFLDDGSRLQLAEKAVFSFYEEYKDEINNNLQDLLDIMEDENFHTERKVLRNLVKESKKESKKVLENNNLEYGDIYHYKGYLIQVDDNNEENPEESVCTVYATQDGLDNGVYVTSISVTDEDNIKELIDETVLMYEISGEEAKELLIDNLVEGTDYSNDEEYDEMVKYITEECDKVDKIESEEDLEEIQPMGGDSYLGYAYGKVVTTLKDGRVFASDEEGLSLSYAVELPVSYEIKDDFVKVTKTESVKQDLIDADIQDLTTGEPNTEDYIEFYVNGVLKTSYPFSSTFDGELPNTRQLIAQENGVDVKDVIVKAVSKPIQLTEGEEISKLTDIDKALLNKANDWLNDEYELEDYKDWTDEEKITQWFGNLDIDDIKDLCKELEIPVYNNHLQLSDDRVIWDIVDKLNDDIGINEDTYAEDVTLALSNFEEDCSILDGEVYVDGRMGRHIIIKPTLSNIKNYNNIKDQYMKAQQDFIDSQIEYYNNIELNESKKEGLDKVSELKLMDSAANCCNDEEYIEGWLMYGVPDAATQEDFEDIANSELYDDIKNYFIKLIKAVADDGGLYDCPEDAFNYAKQFAPQLTNTYYENGELKIVESGQTREEYSKPIKINDKTFRYNYKTCEVEYIADLDDGIEVIDSVGLAQDNWNDKQAREEYINDWANELEEESDRLASDFIKYESKDEKLSIFTRAGALLGTIDNYIDEDDIPYLLDKLNVDMEVYTGEHPIPEDKLGDVLYNGINWLADHLEKQDFERVIHSLEFSDEEKDKYKLNEIILDVLDEAIETEDLYIYSDANSDNEQDAKANIMLFKQEAPKLEFKLHKDGDTYFIDFIGDKQDIIDYLTKLGWYGEDEIKELDIIRKLNESKKVEATDISERVKLLKLMDRAARCVNDDNAFQLWLMLAIPDEDDYEEVAKDDKIYEEITKEFEKVMKLANENGALYDCPAEAFKLARKYEPNIENYVNGHKVEEKYSSIQDAKQKLGDAWPIYKDDLEGKIMPVMTKQEFELYWSQRDDREEYADTTYEGYLNSLINAGVEIDDDLYNILIQEQLEEAKFKDKVKAIKKSLKDKDGRISDETAEEQAKKIAGSMIKNESEQKEIKDLEDDLDNPNIKGDERVDIQNDIKYIKDKAQKEGRPLTEAYSEGYQEGMRAGNAFAERIKTVHRNALLKKLNDTLMLDKSDVYSDDYRDGFNDAIYELAAKIKNAKSMYECFPDLKK